MNIKLNDNRSVTRFLDLGFGDWFGLEQEIYCKIRDVEAVQGGTLYNTVHIETGELFHTCDSEEVIPIESVEVNIE